MLSVAIAPRYTALYTEKICSVLQLALMLALVNDSQLVYFSQDSDQCIKFVFAASE